MNKPEANMESGKRYPAGSLGASLDHEPVELKFGTSGRRGRVVHLTQLEVYINTLGELEYLMSLPEKDGGIRPGQCFYIGHDLRPSSTRFVPEQGGRGELAQAIFVAALDAGLKPINVGPIPTPALAYHAMLNGAGCIMVTGSHIPFDRNGYKTYSPKGELRKEDEAPVNQRVNEVRNRLYSQPLAESKFNQSGMLKVGHIELPEPDTEWKQVYKARYRDFFCQCSAVGEDNVQAAKVLQGLRVVVYEHSAVGIEVLSEIMSMLGAEVIRTGRSTSFVPIDTENFDLGLASTIQQIAVDVWQKYGPIDAVVSTDGDGDRPLVIAVEPGPGQATPCRIRFFGGDLVGMVTAEFLEPDAVVVPISCNDAIDIGPLKGVIQPKTRIGSPYVIAGMERARHNGHRVVCGFEANGGFLVGTDIRRENCFLKALPTRDAVLPILCVLARARTEGVSISGVFARLPRRFSKSALLPNFPRSKSLAIMRKLSLPNPSIREVDLRHDQPRAVGFDDGPVILSTDEANQISRIRHILEQLFNSELGFGNVIRLNYVDGVRMWFDNGDVAHVRPSGNADELRIYAVADSQERAEAIAAMAVQEPDGILRQMERLLA